VILSEVHDLPLVEVHLVVKTGGGANAPGAAGLADLTANMLDEGTSHRSALEIAEQIGDLGASLATTASWDASLVSLSTIARSVDSALAIWADVILHPAFSETELSRVRDNLVTAVSRRKDSPPTVASLALARILFGDRHPYAWPQTGVEESLKKLSVATSGTSTRPTTAPGMPPSSSRATSPRPISGESSRRRCATGDRDACPSPRCPPPPAIDKKKIVLIDKPGAPQSSIRVGIPGVRVAAIPTISPSCS
jgi:zinc protease